MNSRFLITASVLLFLVVGTFVAIKWAEGYRLNLSQQTIEGTGLLVANSQPQGASVYLNDKLATATNDTLHLNPGSYRVKLEKDGYHTWEKTLDIENELVTQTNARLFPSVPNLSALTVNGASQPAPSPDGNKIAFKVASSSAATKHGIWVVSLNDSPLRLSSNAILIAQDTNVVKFSEAQLFWSPNSNEILAYFNDNQAYLLNATTLNRSDNLINAAFQIPSLISDWEQQILFEKERRIAKLPVPMQQIATESATLVYFSPSEEKMLYVATQSATLTDKLVPPIPASNSQPQQRQLLPGNLYVYDSKEDRNFLIAKNVYNDNELDQAINDFNLNQSLEQSLSLVSVLPTTTPKIAHNTKPILNQLKAIQAQYSPWYSLKIVQWYPDSSHLIYLDNSGINIIEYDGTNKVTVFGGLYTENFAYPWPNGQKIVLLTSLTNNPDISVNFYVLDLQ